MSYEGQRPEVTAVYRQHSELAGPDFGHASVQFVSPGSLSGGSFGLFRWDMAPHAGGPSPHFHKTFSESFYVLSGRVDLYDGQRWVDAGPGDFVHVPKWGIHAFRNSSDGRASMLILFSPGTARESYFEELADLARTGRQLTADEWRDLYARHDVFMT